MEKLHFKTSSGIKNILGKELITDRYVAIFELVKNGYDARAENVNVIFDNQGMPPSITIKDDGIGMDKNDLINKWLFLAYSEKKEGERNDNDRIFVGSKGVGRFSCDSLGDKLVLKTKKESEDIIHILTIDWRSFETSLLTEVEDIDVIYQAEAANNLKGQSFTELTITGLRHHWGKKEIDNAKNKLERLKNPFIHNDGFNIYCRETPQQSDDDSIVYNNISLVLKEKSTSIEAKITKQEITITLIDRNKIIYKLSKPNNGILPNVEIDIFIYYLTTSAKNNFRRKMKIEAVNYGNIFIYKNNFHVSPYGNVDYDLFGLNLRKGQGYKRYISTREIIGCISIKDKYNKFQETTSRNNGFIYNAYMIELQKFYMEEIHRPFEKYIQLIKWGEDSDTKKEVYYDDIKEDSETDKFKNSLKRRKDFNLDYFVDDLSFEENRTKKQLERISEDLPKDKQKVVKKIAKKLDELTFENEQKENAIKEKEKEVQQLKRQNKNLLAERTADSYSKQISHHFTKIAEQLKGSLEDLITLKQDKYDNTQSSELLVEIIEQIRRTELEVTIFRDLLLNSSVEMRSPQNINLFETTEWYFKERDISKGVNISIYLLDESLYDKWNLHCYFLDFIMCIENFYKNAIEHGATIIEFAFGDNKLNIINNSKPIDESIFESIFEMGFSTKEKGTGIGLFQIKEFCDENNMSICVANIDNRVQFTIERK